MATSLMSLPYQIKLRILGFVEFDASNTHQSLRQTHPWFRENISIIQLRNHLEAAEKYLRPFPAGYLICYTCLKFLPTDQFADPSLGRRNIVGGVRAYDRFCLGCGIKHGKYSPGTSIVANRKKLTVCKECRKLFPTRDHLADKMSCRTSSDVQRFSQNRNLCKECGD